MLSLLFSDPTQLLFWAGALLTAITVHEFAHAYSADRLGDPTPRVQGRLTLNPIRHLDPIGTIALLLVGFGWGKPVQFDPYNLENPRRDAAIISFAGPLSNILLAVALSGTFYILSSLGLITLSTLPIFTPFIYLNVLLAVFNLVPIHPLDGGKILVGLLPPEDARSFDAFLKQYGLFILLILILPIFQGRPLIFYLIGPSINFLLNFFLPGPRLI